ncbi:Hypothetical protein PHPALM_9968 [Phytophthora palmivora]|uniref:Retrotransposon gag domain-containing protein n=1 Tax=Phytophthora palmivora TaxID=4796 RepID=A0A2P4Y5V9_9STRA|nr:Hypothetical protein PHPALM_9968 [Phytophthora palmivora]
MATTIPQSILTTRECVAILQTLFFEAGFEFVNLISGWSATRASRIPESLVRSVMEEVQNFIAVELVEWRVVTAGVPFKVNSEDHAAPSVQEKVPRLEYHKEDGDGDLLMTDYDADRLGHQFVLRFRVTGLRISRSPRGSSDGEPQSKRSQHGPPRPPVPSTPSALSTPSLSSLPAYKSSTSTSLQNSTPLNSISNGRESLEMEAKDAVPDLVPSVIGTSRASDESTASGAQTSYGSSSSSSMRSLGQQVGALALVAQSASGFAAAGDLGFQVTRTVIPHSHVAVEQEGVEMASSVHSDPEIAPKKTGLSRISAATAEPKLRVSSLSSGFDGMRNVGGDEQSQHQNSKSEAHSRRSTRSRKSVVSSRSSASRSASSVSSRSGPAQIELNVLRRQQEWQARMEQEQREFLARERLDALELERLREQRDLDARRQIQELTDRLVHAEIARREAERRAQDVEVHQAQRPTETQGPTQNVMEAVRLEREHLDATYVERWQKREAEADAERARWASEVHAGWKDQMSTMEQKVQELEAERERESSQNIQRFHAGQVRDLRATLAQVQGRRATATPDLATNVRSSVAQSPETATRSQETDGVISGNAIVAGQRQGTADPRNTPEVAVSQRKATFVQSSVDTSGRTKHVKRGHGVPETKVAQDVKSEPVPVGKTGSKRSVSKKHRQDKKKRRDVNPPSDSDPSSDSSDDDSSSESSEDSSDEDAGVNLTAASATQAGTTLPVHQLEYSGERVHWWERFANMAAQGGWSTKMRTQEIKLKLPGAARDWFNQLPKHTQRDWKELASAFRKKYCKARSSYSERYFTMEMKNSESALDFFYRLNSAAAKADIDFRKSSKPHSEIHHETQDTRLKTSLQGQRFRNIADLEYSLEQDEEVWSRSDRDAPPPRVRDFRADNIPQGRFKSKRTGRAYVTRGDVSDSESDEDPELHARFQEVIDEPSVSARVSSTNSGSTREISGEEVITSGVGNLPSTKGVEWTQTLTNEVYRVMDHMGWRPPNAYSGSNANPGFRSPRRENPHWDKFCEKCRKWGHPEEDCWKDRKCDRCLETGHPTHMCRAQPCENCGKMHLGKPCKDWKTLEAVKKLARQGALKDMPSQIQDKLLDGEATSGRPSNQ